MSYYAAFHAAKSILSFLGEETRTHRGTSARFHYRAVRESDFPADVANLLGRLRVEREDADYEVLVEGVLDNSTAITAIARAERFVRQTEAWFDRHRPADN